MAPFSTSLSGRLFPVRKGLTTAALLLLSCTGWAEKIKIEFLPPPMEGAFSLGIYNAQDQRVRTLHAEAPLDAFVIALNGLVTYWDGKDDHGKELPPGRYTAKGFRVADFKIEGIGFIGNDWIDEEEGPRLRRIERIAAVSDTELMIEATVPGSDEPLLFIATPKETKEPAEAAPAPDEAVALDWSLTPAPEGTRFPASATTKKTENPEKEPEVTWLLQGSTLLQLVNGEASHSIEVQNSYDPSPTQHTLSPSARALFVLDENDSLQRLWGLLFPKPADAPDEAAALFIKTIHSSHTLAAATELLKLSEGKPVDVLESHTVQPIHNPLLKEKKPPRVTLRVGVDKGGTYLATADGLLLDRISETPHLLWAAIGRTSKKDSEIVVFESDGAVIGEFKVSGLDQIMSFNAGTFDWKPSKTEPEPEPSATPAPTASSEASSSPEATPADASGEEEAQPPVDAEPGDDAPPALEASEASPTPRPQTPQTP